MKKRIISELLVFCLIFTAVTTVDAASKGKNKSYKTETTTAVNKTYTEVNSIDVANYPAKYLNKNIKIKGTFDKFSTLGLDYSPAMRDSKDYIGFLITKPSNSEHKIPFSEMKIFMKRKMAEKYIDLNAGDEIEFEGFVFSTALNDPWIEVEHLTVIKKFKQPENDKK